MNQEHTSNRLLSDNELRPLLEAHDIIVFTGLADKANEISVQVDYLGFDKTYRIQFTKEPPGNWTKLIPNPDYQVDTKPSQGLSKIGLVERLKSKHYRQG